MKTIPVTINDLIFAKRNNSALLNYMMKKTENYAPLVMDLIINGENGIQIIRTITRADQI